MNRNDALVICRALNHGKTRIPGKTAQQKADRRKEILEAHPKSIGDLNNPTYIQMIEHWVEEIKLLWLKEGLIRKSIRNSTFQILLLEAYPVPK